MFIGLLFRKENKISRNQSIELVGILSSQNYSSLYIGVSTTM